MDRDGGRSCGSAQWRTGHLNCDIACGTRENRDRQDARTGRSHTRGIERSAGELLWGSRNRHTRQGYGLRSARRQRCCDRDCATSSRLNSYRTIIRQRIVKHTSYTDRGRGARTRTVRRVTTIRTGYSETASSNTCNRHGTTARRVQRAACIHSPNSRLRRSETHSAGRNIRSVNSVNDRDGTRTSQTNSQRRRARNSSRSNVQCRSRYGDGA